MAHKRTRNDSNESEICEPPPKLAKSSSLSLTNRVNSGHFQLSECSEQSKDAGGGGEPAEPSGSIGLKRILFKKFENAQIYIDFWKVSPTKVWFLEKGAEPEKHCHYDIIYPGVGLKEDGTIETSRIVRVIENYQAKWERSAQAGQPEHNEDMCVMMSIIQEMSSCLVFGFDNVKQAWETPDLLGRIYEAKLRALAEKHEVLVDRFEEGKLLDALQEGMTNSSGRRAVESIFAVARRVAFGKDDRQKANVYPVGSSPVEHESFPVYLIDSVRHSVGSHYDFRTKSPSSVSECSSAEMKYSGKGVHADVIVASCHEPNWPRFLFVVEVKSKGVLTDCHTAQLMREMLGPLMHQSMVFGLLINCQQASLYLIEHESHEKKVYVSRINYHFVDDMAFSAQVFKKLFIDIVAVLDYSKNNIKEISHGF